MWLDLETEKDREMLTTPRLVQQQPCSWALGVVEAKWSSLMCLENGRVYHESPIQACQRILPKSVFTEGKSWHGKWSWCPRLRYCIFNSNNCRRQGCECCANPPSLCSSRCSEFEYIPNSATIHIERLWLSGQHFLFAEVMKLRPWTWEMCFCRVWSDWLMHFPHLETW